MPDIESSPEIVLADSNNSQLTQENFRKVLDGTLSCAIEKEVLREFVIKAMGGYVTITQDLELIQAIVVESIESEIPESIPSVEPNRETFASRFNFDPDPIESLEAATSTFESLDTPSDIFEVTSSPATNAADASLSTCSLTPTSGLPQPLTPKRIGKRTTKKTYPIISSQLHIDDLKGTENKKIDEKAKKVQRINQRLVKREQKLINEAKKLQVAKAKACNNENIPPIRHFSQLNSFTQPTFSYHLDPFNQPSSSNQETFAHHQLQFQRIPFQDANVSRQQVFIVEKLLLLIHSQVLTIETLEVEEAINPLKRPATVNVSSVPKKRGCKPKLFKSD